MDYWVLIAVLCLMTAVVFYLRDWLSGSSTSSRIRGIPSTRTLTTVFFGLGIFVLRFQPSPAEALDRLSEYVRPYPHGLVVDSSEETNVQMWRLETTDSVEEILSYYSDIANQDGWDFERTERADPWFLLLRGPTLEVGVQIIRRPEDLVEIAYTVRALKPNASPEEPPSQQL